MHLYDDAIISKFRDLFDTDKIFIVPPERAKETRAQLSNDNIDFPLISLDRRGWSMLPEHSNWTASRKGVADSISPNGKANMMHILPIRINYQLDVYTVDRVSCDEIMRELIFYFTLHPSMTVKIPYGLNTEHKFNVFFNPDIEDNSDTVEHINKGTLFRYTATLYTDDAYLYANTPVDLVFGGFNNNLEIAEAQYADN